MLTRKIWEALLDFQNCSCRSSFEFGNAMNSPTATTCCPKMAHLANFVWESNAKEVNFTRYIIIIFAIIPLIRMRSWIGRLECVPGWADRSDISPRIPSRIVLSTFVRRPAAVLASRIASLRHFGVVRLSLRVQDLPNSVLLKIEEK